MELQSSVLLLKQVEAANGEIGGWGIQALRNIGQGPPQTSIFVNWWTIFPTYKYNIGLFKF